MYGNQSLRAERYRWAKAATGPLVFEKPVLEIKVINSNSGSPILVLLTLLLSLKSIRVIKLIVWKSWFLLLRIILSSVLFKLQVVFLCYTGSSLYDTCRQKFIDRELHCHLQLHCLQGCLPFPCPHICMSRTECQVNFSRWIPVWFLTRPGLSYAHRARALGPRPLGGAQKWEKRGKKVRREILILILFNFVGPLALYKIHEIHKIT